MTDRRKTAEKRLRAFFGDGPSSDLPPKMHAAMARLRELAKQRDTGVADMLLAGRYRYTDAPGAPAVDVEVLWELGDCIVHFPPVDGDEGEDVLFMDMAASENWREHFERAA